MQDNKRGIGDNSIQDDKYKNFAEHIKDISSRLWKLHSTISSTINTHTASHGDEFYFPDEINNQKDIDRYGYKPEWGNTRRPNPYEKKEFAGETTNKLNETATQLTKLAMEAAELEKKLSKKDEVDNG